MIKYNNLNINDWWRSSSAITKVMYNGSQAYRRKVRVLPTRWVVDDTSYLCVNYDKYEKEVKEYSLDDGVTWTKYIPEISRTGDLIFSGSVDCGAAPQERWVVDASSYICEGYDKYAKEIKQYALDDYGIEWANYVPEVSRKGTLIKQNARQCGYTGDTQEPCYAVVDTIVGYSDTEFVDVFDLSANKWYKLNNLNQFEEYGIYGSGRTIPYYEGKLTIDGDYEYIYSGSSWVNVGEVSGTSVIIKSPEYIERTSTYNGYCSLLEYLTEDTKIIIKHRQTNAGGGRIIGDFNSNDSDDWRFFFFGSTLYYDFITQRKSTDKSMPMPSAEEWEVGNYYIKDTTTSFYYINSTPQTFSSRPDNLYIYHSGGVGAGESGEDYGEIYYIKIYKNNELVRDFIPWTDMNGNYGLYDKVEKEYVQTTGQMTASTVINDVEIGTTIYPINYDAMQAPPNNISFSSMTQAEDYECPWVGMRVTINGSAYTFNANYEWEEVLAYWNVSTTEWQTSTDYGNLPSTGYTFYESFSNYHQTNSTATTYITIYGYESFSFKIRSYGETCCDYVEVYDIDSDSTIKLSDSNNSQEYQWTDVTFTGISPNVEHTIKVIYKKDGSVDSGSDRGYIAIPNNQ